MSQQPTVSQRIAQELHGQILRRHYTAGERLPSERELASHHGVSRIPVREAIKILEQQGIVEIKHGSGNYVKYIDKTKISEQISQYLLLCDPEIGEFTEIWMILECEVVAQACKYRTEEQLSEIKMLADECAAEVRCALNGQPFDFAETNYAFHENIIRISSNTLIANLLCSFRRSIAFKNSILAKHSSEWGKIIGIHSALVEAIANRNEKQAKRAIWEDVSLSGSLFLTFTARYKSHEIFGN